MATDPAASIWLRPARAGRGPAPAFDRDRLAAAGVALADERGLAAVTMRAVAQSLGSAPASLYRYVTTRDELLELMADQVGAEISYARPGPGAAQPIAELLALAHESRRCYLRHPWLLDAAPPHSRSGPHAVTYLEHALAALDPLPASAQTKLEAVAVMNAVVAALSRAELGREQAGESTPQWQQAQHAYLSRVVASGRHPHVAAVLTQAGPGAGEDTADGLFDRVVTRVLTGLLEAGED